VRSIEAVSQLASSIQYLTFNPAVRTMAVRLLGRILGKDLALLLGTVAGTNPKGARSTHEVLPRASQPAVATVVVAVGAVAVSVPVVVVDVAATACAVAVAAAVVVAGAAATATAATALTVLAVPAV
jgi:hypothetical protein